MIVKYTTKIIGDKTYIIGSRLISEKGSPSEKFEFSSPFAQDLLDARGKLQWTIQENPDYNPDTDHIDDRYLIEHDPIQPTAEELESARRDVIKQKIAADFPDLVLQNKDNPTVLAQVLCDRAKQIEAEIQEAPGVMEKL